MWFSRKVLIVIGAIALIIPSAISPALAADDDMPVQPGLPGRRISGGSRGECLSGAQPLVALNPATNLGVTASSSPSLHFVVSTLNESYATKFSLRDAQRNKVYEGVTTIEQGQEILSVQIPEKSLQADQRYSWRLSVICDPEDSAQNIVLSGSLQQSSQRLPVYDSIPSASLTESSLEDGIELARAYKEAELWSDAVSAVVALRQRYPEDRSVRAEWTDLLRSLELENVVEPAIATR